MKRSVAGGSFLLAAFLLAAAALPAFPDGIPSRSETASRGDAVSVSVDPREPFAGDPVLVRIVASPPPDNVAIGWKGRDVPAKDAGGGTYVALIGVDFMEKPGEAELAATAFRGGRATRSVVRIAVREKAFSVQKLTVPKRMARFDDATLERIRREAETLERRLAGISPPAWDLPFLPPVEDFRPVGFGARRIINEEPRSPHAGVDVNVPEGTPVSAIAAGTVAFAGEQFFGGRSVALDHGAGVFSVYYHLGAYEVTEGQRVAKGQRIGAAGMSGRATGPHLHFGVRVPGGRIDPSGLFGPSFR